MLRIVIATTDPAGKHPIIGDATIDDAGQVKWTKASPEATAAVLRLTQADIVDPHPLRAPSSELPAFP